ncbi:MAG: multidrug efflux SMR transporter [Deltaproteobacteria bacterium]|nr:multidrug efflux SMR transporter [Deltaproteobacteria bacterium]
MAWINLLMAGFLEVGWAVSLKFTDGWTRVIPSILTALLMAASFYFLALALRAIPIGTAYAVWTGIGALGTAVIGMLLFQEPCNAARIAFLGLILIGIAGLKATSPH